MSARVRVRRGLVVGVEAPKVAHAVSQQWAVTVVYLLGHGPYAKKIRKQIFASYYPQIGSWIEFQEL